jgi:hypothetical protein
MISNHEDAVKNLKARNKGLQWRRQNGKWSMLGLRAMDA